MLSTQFCPTCGAANESAQAQCFACGHTLTTDTLATPDTPLLHERYQLGTVLGSGGFSTVYRGRDMQSGREVAIKQISLQGLSAEEAIEATDTFNREASVLSSLHHPQVPQIYDQFNDQDHWYLVLQYIEGPTLERYLETRTAQGKPLQFDEVLEMALQLGEVLNYLHTRQPPIIFRDLKPSNVIRTPPKGTLFLVDFGIARRFHPGQKRDTQALGSPGYAAPEQYGRAQTTPRSDIYSLGALLHFLFSGDDPAEEMSPDLKPLSLHAEKGAEALSELVQRMLSPDPEQRPASMRKVIKAFEDIQQQRAAQPAARIWHPPVPQDLPFLASSRQVRVPASSPLAAGRGGVDQRKRLHPPFLSRTINGLLTGQPSFQKLSDTAYAYLGHTASVNAVAWSPDGKDIASASDDKTVQVWNATTGHRARTYRGYMDEVNAVAWSPNGQYIAFSSLDGTVQIWNTATDEFVWSFVVAGGFSLSWSPDSKRIAASTALADGSTVQVWKISSGKTVLTYRGYMDEVNAVAWSPNGQPQARNARRAWDLRRKECIASGFFDGTMQVWNAISGKVISTYRGHMDAVLSIAWSPNGQHIASSSDDGTIQIWEVTTGKILLTYQGHMRAVYSVAWSPDGRYIAFDADNNTVQVWEAFAGKPVSIYQGHTDAVLSVAWSPDGKRIASGSSDRSVQVWNAP